MNIILTAKKLGFPLGEYVVVGGAMEAYGIRKANDIDVVVTKKLFNELIQKGWVVCDCDTCREMISKRTTKRILKKPGVDILSEYSWYDKYHANTEELIKNAVVIDGVPFVRVEELLKWKQAAGREKDLKDIELLEKYLTEK